MPPPVMLPHTIPIHSLAMSSSSFVCNGLLYSGWSTIVRQVALTYTASIVVALAAWHAHLLISSVLPNGF